MALKTDREEIVSDISYFCNAVCERGGIISLSTGGSGSAMDQALAVANYAANPSGKMPLGILMNDVVNLDLTRQHKNFHKDEVQINGKVTIWQQCKVVTNMIQPGITVTAGDYAYASVSGYITNADLGAAATPVVGRFLSSKNEEGYAKVFINLPNARS